LSRRYSTPRPDAKCDGCSRSLVSTSDSTVTVAAGKKRLQSNKGVLYLRPLSSGAEGLSSSATTELPSKNKQRAPGPWTSTSGEETDVSGGRTSEFDLRRPFLGTEVLAATPTTQRSRPRSAGPPRPSRRRSVRHRPRDE